MGSGMNIKELPSEVADLKFVTCMRMDSPSQGFLGFYLHNNAMSVLPRELFQVLPLNVLTLRVNQLTEISWEIEKLSNLEEFSIGNNQLRFLPAEILKLPKLKTFLANPNPWMKAEEIEQFNQAQEAKQSCL